MTGTERNLDAALAEALGYVFMERKNDTHQVWGRREGDTMELMVLPHYSTDGNAMLELDREMREQGFRLVMTFSQTDDGKFMNFGALYKSIDCDNKGWGEADDEPLARALAAHKALTGKEWERS